MSAESETADVFDFVDAYLVELERGNVQPLAYWLQRFPRSQTEVAREWLALSAPATVAGEPIVAGTLPDDGEPRLGPYRVLRELGRGGQGTVFLAEDSRIARRVALKVLASGFDTVSDEKRQRFRREADVIARLEHPGLCTIHDADLSASMPWIAMRFVEGRTVADCLAEARQSAGADVFGLHLPPRAKLETDAVLLLFERAARALHAAHEAGVVHRDVKPGNIIVALDGRPVLLDFGLARDDESQVGTITQTGDLFGTPAYMSPEQLTNPSGALDRRTDVYSLGVTLFEALTLTRPFDHAARTELYRSILEDPVPDARKRNPALPGDVQVVLETALEKDRDRRYATALELAEDLRRIREYEPIHARPASVRVRFARWTKRHPSLAVATIGTILALSIGLAVTLQLLANERRALRYAVGRQLAQRAVALAAEDPPVALALGIEAVDRAPNDLTRSSLFRALEACWLLRAIEPELDGRKVTALGTSSSSGVGAIGFSDGAVHVIDLDTGDRLLRIDTGDSGVSALEFDPSGKRLLSTAADGTARVDDATSGAALGMLGFEGSCVRARFSADGKSLLSVLRSGRAQVLDASTLASRAVLGPHGEPFTSAAFSPDGSLVLALAPAHEAVIFDARTGQRLRELDCGPLAVAGVFVPRDLSARVIVAGTDGSVGAFDARSGKSLGATAHVDGVPTALTACPDGRHAVVLVGAEDEGWAYACDLEAGTVRRIEEHDGHLVTQAAYSPDGTRFATTSYDASLRIFDTRTGLSLRTLRIPFRQIDVCWSADGDRLIARTMNFESVHLWYARARPDVYDLEGHTAAVSTVCFSPDGEMASSAADDGTARLWRTPLRGAGHHAGAPVAVLHHAGPLLLSAFSNDGKALLTASVSGDAGTWNPADGTPLRPIARHPARLVAAAIDGRGAHFATLCADGLARVWDVHADIPPVVMEGAPTALSCVSFSSDGALLAVGGDAGEVRVHSARDGRLLRSSSVPVSSKPAVRNLAFRPGGTELAIACGDNYVRFVDAIKGTPTRSFQDLAGKKKAIDGWRALPCKSLAFSRDGSHLLVTGKFGGRAVRSKTLALVANPDVPEPDASTIPRTSHLQDITSATYDDACSVVLTTSKDKSADVWSAMDGAPFTRREGFSAGVTCGALSSAGGTLRAITGCADGSVCVWPVDPLPLARARLPRKLEDWEEKREIELAKPLELDFGDSAREVP